MNSVNIVDVRPDSIASELGIEKGDKLLTINGASIRDTLEYRFLTTDEFLEVEILKKNGECWIYEVEKEYDDDIGIVFDGIIDDPKSCHNKCLFCFVDQLPKGMRETLYFKDDDTRLSFLQGNFVTLTNLKAHEIDKIIKYRISPINVSVHTTDSDLRVKMLNNKNAGKIVDYLAMLKEGGIEIKAQIVLCPGINDGQYLEKTVKDLKAFYPELSCLAVVPVGLTRYRENLPELKVFDKENANRVINQIEALQAECLKELDTRFVFLSDEFYLTADRALPLYDAYEGFSQLENGVGLVTLLHEEIESSLMDITDTKEHHIRNIVIATGEYAAPLMIEAADKIKDKIKQLQIEVVSLKNDFFGHGVKVAGLLTGQDIINQLKENKLIENLLITDSMLRDGEAVFLDDITIEQIEKQLNVKISVCKEDGSDLVAKILAI
jgi:putative radical SAM enzyme (TIGR03279 family)